MPDGEVTILSLRNQVAAFVRARDWEQFHNPKDLAAAITIEGAELMELFLWKDLQEVREEVEGQQSRRAIEEELADIVILCLSLSNRLDIDVSNAVRLKLGANDANYPAELVRGKAHKYTHYKKGV